MAYEDFKDLNRRTTAGKMLIKIRNMTDINMDLLQWFIIYLIEKLHKPIIRKFEKRKIIFYRQKIFYTQYLWC